ncbi:fungal-specific transcription factor domain-containing protein [Truncatella angustata]|uniref:Fungal-specific transcription factor domain-containing protein n=1 Tax=Truncatella angustata TaxID=152316 RepID=A0A9P8UTY3_9PEZI|nr:fungal-specific transcription factor domain-containing protein [Truncatella angustata]KAH6658149.1 fungal-specific transcription factor domain-containing protein [Truncatella angustata]
MIYKRALCVLLYLLLYPTISLVDLLDAQKSPDTALIYRDRNFHHFIFSPSCSATGGNSLVHAGSLMKYHNDDQYLTMPPINTLDYPGQRSDHCKPRAAVQNALVRCETCKMKRAKCDGGYPTCGWCQRRNVLCEYRDKTAGSGAGFGKGIEQRMNKPEYLLGSLEDKCQSECGGVPNISGSDVMDPSFIAVQMICDDSAPNPWDSNLTGTSQVERALYVQTPSAHTISALGKSLYLPPLSNSTRSNSFEPSMSFASISPLTQTSTTPPNFTTQESASTWSVFQLPGPDAIQIQDQLLIDGDLPPRNILYTLINLYFEHINTWCPILQKEPILIMLLSLSTLNETDQVLLHAIVAISLRYFTDTSLNDGKKEQYYKVSKDKVLLFCIHNSSLKTLQALLILALDLYWGCSKLGGWNITTIITRTATQLGLTVENTSFLASPYSIFLDDLRPMTLPDSQTFVENESRRRLFWMIYILDRYVAMETSFDFALNDEQIRRRLPCHDEFWIKNHWVETKWFQARYSSETLPDHIPNQHENLGAFSYHVELFGILSEICRFLKDPIDITFADSAERWQRRYEELDILLMSWQFSLPTEYRNISEKHLEASDQPLDCIWIMLQATYCTATIQLHSSAIRHITNGSSFGSLSDANHSCFCAVEDIATLAVSALGNGLLTRLGPPLAFSLYIAARHLLIHGRALEQKPSSQAAILVNTLREIGRYWTVAVRYLELL